MKKLPTQLNTTWSLGNTINTNFQSLEQLYTDLKYAFGGLNFIQLYGNIPYWEKESETTTENGVTTNVASYYLNYSKFPSTTPGSTYLASSNIIDNNNELGLGRVIPMGTFIVSTNDGWKPYNPVFTTHIYRPVDVSVSMEQDWEYKLKYNYDLIEIPKDKNTESSSITMEYLDINETIRCEEIVAWKQWSKTITLKNSYPTSGLAVRLEGPDGEVDYLGYTVLGNNQIRVKFYPTESGPYKIHIHYGYRPRVTPQTNS